MRCSLGSGCVLEGRLESERACTRRLLAFSLSEFEHAGGVSVLRRITETGWSSWLAGCENRGGAIIYMQGETRRQSAGGLCSSDLQWRSLGNIYQSEGPGGRHPYHSRARSVQRAHRCHSPWPVLAYYSGSDPDYTDWSVGTSASTPHNLLLIVPSVISIKSVKCDIYGHAVIFVGYVCATGTGVTPSRRCGGTPLRSVRSRAVNWLAGWARSITIIQIGDFC
jgi:hypothetical protein